MQALSDRQAAFIDTLVAERATDGIVVPENREALTKAEASDLIGRLLKAPYRDKPKAERAELEFPVPGFYAMQYDGVLRFYVVREGKGRWAGRRFISPYRSDYLDRVPYAEQAAVLPSMVLHTEASQRLFAAETKHCYRCGRRLTDAESRARGLGKDCAALAGL
jgi:hypothetical protein